MLRGRSEHGKIRPETRVTLSQEMSNLDTRLKIRGSREAYGHVMDPGDLGGLRAPGVLGPWESKGSGNLGTPEV